MKHLLTFGLLLAATASFSQSYTKNGVVVNQAGDSLRGQISIPRSHKSPKYIDFAQGEVVTRYRPDEVKYFRLGDEASYVGVIMDIDKSPTKLKSNEDPVNDGVVRDTVFLSIVVLGKMSLYKLVDERSNVRYFIGSEGSISQLILRVTRVDSGNGATGTYEFVARVYKDQLKKKITNCATAEPWTDKTDYTQSHLSRLVLKYNSCHNDVPVFIQKTPGPTFVAGVFGGMVNSKLDNRGSLGGPSSRAHYSNSTTPTGGLILEMLAPKMRQRASLIGELMMYKVSFDADHTTPGNAYFYNIEYLRFNLGGRFYFSNKKLKPYIQAGLGIGRAFHTSFFSGNPVDQQFQPTKNDQGLHVAGGLKYGRFGFQVRYEKSPGFSETRGFVSKIENVSALLTFDLSKPKGVGASN